MKPSPTPEEWIELGLETTELLERVGHVTRIIADRHRKNDPIVRKGYKYWDAFNRVRWQLDSAVCEAYPLSVATLPGHNDIRLVQVFTDLGRRNGPRFEPSSEEAVGGPFRVLPRDLTTAQRDFIHDTIKRTNVFMDGSAKNYLKTKDVDRYTKAVSELLHQI